ncbi:MAG TPA: hypothetical protein VFM82_02250 [Flavobacteriaceae bacterium]|nr:hypothetical protein [Flavobacteriaceae bacterium]
MEIAVSGKNKRLVKLVENLAKELGLSIRILDDNQNMSQGERSEKLYQLMEEMAKNNVFAGIEDPVEWQREQRKDRPLPGRE